MKKTTVISGTGVHQVALSPDQRLAGSKHVNRQAVFAEAQPLARKKRAVAGPELKNSPLSRFQSRRVKHTNPTWKREFGNLGR